MRTGGMRNRAKKSPRDPLTVPGGMTHISQWLVYHKSFEDEGICTLTGGTTAAGCAFGTGSLMCCTNFSAVRTAVMTAVMDADSAPSSAPLTCRTPNATAGSGAHPSSPSCQASSATSPSSGWRYSSSPDPGSCGSLSSAESTLLARLSLPARPSGRGWRSA